MTSREHARRLMLILLSGTRSTDPQDTADDERHGGDDEDDDRQDPDARDDSTDEDEQTDRGATRGTHLDVTSCCIADASRGVRGVPTRRGDTHKRAGASTRSRESPHAPGWVPGGWTQPPPRTTPGRAPGGSGAAPGGHA